MTYTPSNVGRTQDDEKGFDDIFWQRLCKKYRHLNQNTTTTEFVFDIADVRKDVIEERGLGINAYEEPFIEKRLEEIDGQGLIKFIPERRQFYLTADGIQYCKEILENVR